jgi:hypothetical protein
MRSQKMVADSFLSVCITILAISSLFQKNDAIVVKGENPVLSEPTRTRIHFFFLSKINKNCLKCCGAVLVLVLVVVGDPEKVGFVCEVIRVSQLFFEFH